MLPQQVLARIYKMMLETESCNTKCIARLSIGNNPTKDALILACYRETHPIFMKIYQECSYWLNNKSEYRARHIDTEITDTTHTHTYEIIDKYDNIEAIYTKQQIVKWYTDTKRKWTYKRVSNGRKYVIDTMDSTIIYELVPRTPKKVPLLNIMIDNGFKRVKIPENNFINKRFQPLYKYDEYIPTRNSSNILKNKIVNRFEDITFITKE